MTVNTNYGTPEERAARGAAFFVEKFGDKWGRKIDERALDMGNSLSCAFSQVSGEGYFRACRNAGLDYSGNEARRLGFWPALEDASPSRPEEISALNKAFIAEARKAR